jgi:hypothetical protein
LDEDKTSEGGRVTPDVSEHVLTRRDTLKPQGFGTAVQRGVPNTRSAQYTG